MRNIYYVDSLVRFYYLLLRLRDLEPSIIHGRTLIIYVICIDVYNDYHKDKQVQKSLPQTTIQKVMKALDLYDVHRKLHDQHKRKRV